MKRSEMDIDPADIEDGIHYPSSDGKPMAESDLHAVAMAQLLFFLRELARRRQWIDFYAVMNMFVYLQQRDPKRHLAPDVFAMRPVVDPQRPRKSWKFWNEGGVLPFVVFEISSEKTFRNDLTRKRRIYRRLGVKEYFIFDPTRQLLEQPMLGYRLAGTRYRRLKIRSDGSMLSKELGVRLLPQEGLLRLIDAVSGEVVPTTPEQVALTEAERLRREQAEDAAQTEKLQRQQAEDAVQKQRLQLQQTVEAMQKQRLQLEQAEAAIRELLARLGQNPPPPK